MQKIFIDIALGGMESLPMAARTAVQSLWEISETPEEFEKNLFDLAASCPAVSESSALANQWRDFLPLSNPEQIYFVLLIARAAKSFSDKFNFLPRFEGLCAQAIFSLALRQHNIRPDIKKICEATGFYQKNNLADVSFDVRYAIEGRIFCPVDTSIPLEEIPSEIEEIFPYLAGVMTEYTPEDIRASLAETSTKKILHCLEHHPTWFGLPKL